MTNLSKSETFFLWGPRQAGKTSLLKMVFPDVPWIDLLKTEEFRRYTEYPERLREEIAADKDVSFIVIDEVQKVPELLNEVHWLIENRQIHFALCGSSARKVKRGHANLLGGRAVRHELRGLVSTEIGSHLDLNRLLNNGYLPRHYLSNSPKRLLNAYVADYLKEEIAAEGLVRQLPAFSHFLNIAALSDTEFVNNSNIARECGVSSHTVRSYFEILVDTLQGRWLPAYRKRIKRRLIHASKFYFSDVGVVNFLAKRNHIEQGSTNYGKAFENWLFHELSAYNAYRERFAELSYWRLPSGVEVDFIINDMEVAIEAKATSKITTDHLKGIRNLKAEHPTVKQCIIVCHEQKQRVTSDHILICPAHAFIEKLWSGEIF